MSKLVKKVAAVHDLAGIGRCSLTAAIPILSVLGVQACPLPTAILSCQTDYPRFHFFDFTDEMKPYIDTWNSMELKFDGIYSGFLGSEEQINIVIDLIEKHNDALIVVDPVMGDNGEKYKTYTVEMCDRVRELVRHADVVTPNLTECCILTDRSY
ncbi:bifunctional hydroxymethylpyrimidine kinase/phosphomethylpyrimidine kinase, partial [Clostridium saudiense]|nr:bifunctional hydroxymethylpyrimidine kinase/phosphomethylpyrimidine kinase [Clostridium saudiense]